jgi:hypothetical protein
VTSKFFQADIISTNDHSENVPDIQNIEEDRRDELIQKDDSNSADNHLSNMEIDDVIVTSQMVYAHSVFSCFYYEIS